MPDIMYLVMLVPVISLIATWLLSKRLAKSYKERYTALLALYKHVEPVKTRLPIYMAVDKKINAYGKAWVDIKNDNLYINDNLVLLSEEIEETC